MATAGRRKGINRARIATGDEAARAGRVEEALACFTQAVKLDPADVEAVTKLSLAQHRLGQHAAAEATARRAVALAPRIAFAHHALGVALHGLQRLDEAAAAYGQAVKLMPDFPDAHWLLGCVWRAQGRYADAQRSVQQALALRPDYAEALSELGALNLLAGNHTAAITHLERAALLQPSNIDTLCNLAQANRAAGRTPQAIEICERVLLWAPESLTARAMLAQLLEGAGRLDALKRCLDEARQAGMSHVGLDLAAARLALREQRLSDAQALLEGTLRVPALNDSDAAEAQLLLGMVLDQQGQPDAAMSCFKSGNARRRAAAVVQAANDPQRYRDEVAALRALCSEELAKALPLALGQPDAPRDPVFLIGFPRSGTTLLEQMLDANPALVAMEERPAVQALLSAFWRDAGADPAAYLRQLTAEQAQSLRDAYWNEATHHVQVPPGHWLVDKLPLNTSAVPVLWRVFPDARFLFAARHPCDVVLSCFMQDFGLNAAMANFLSLEDAVALYAQVLQAWLDFDATLPLRRAVLRYEDLIADVPGTLRPLLESLGLPWHDAMLDHLAHARGRGAINTPSYRQVTQPLYTRAVQRWRRYASALEPHLPQLAPFAAALGYEL